MPSTIDPIDSAITNDPDWLTGTPLRLENVCVTRRGVTILQDVNLRFEPDRRYVIVGPSGAGKSTLLRLLNRLDDPTSGTIYVGDRHLEQIRIETVRRAIGMVFQNSRPLAGTIAENLSYPFDVRGRPHPDQETLRQSIREVGLDPSWLDRDASALSGGERQRLAVAVALMARPEILLLDEPTSALDPTAARLLTTALVARSLRTIAICHHREHAAWLGDTAVWMEAGRVVDVGPTADLLSRHDAPTEETAEHANR